MSDVIPLNLLPVGHTGFVALVTGESSTVQRLKELGFRDGVLVEIVRLSGQNFGFRADDAVNVYVRQTMPMGVAG
jgi:Fe2+ transport system protein FeoA